MAKTFLELVNRAIDECKITLDPLTSANFADPPSTAMYNRIKRWVNDAYEELLTTRNEWFCRVERTNLVVYPRIHITNNIVTPAVGYIYEGRTTGVRFEVFGVYTSEDAAVDEVQEYTLDVEYEDDANFHDLYVMEELDIVYPAPTTQAAIVKGQGYYDFTEMVDNLEHVSEDSLMLYPAIPDEEYPYDQWSSGPSKNGVPVLFLAWEDFWRKSQWGPQVNGSVNPFYMTRTAQGSYVFMPGLNKKHILSLEYTTAIPDLVNWDDVPYLIPEKYQLYLMWRACRSFADFDGNGRLFSRMKKEEDKFMLWMERDESPAVTMGVRTFYA